MDTLSGSVERITFYKPENGYTVVRLRPVGQRGMHVVPKSLLEPGVDNRPPSGIISAAETAVERLFESQLAESFGSP